MAVPMVVATPAKWGSTVMVRPPRSEAGSRCSGIKLRLTTIAEHLLQGPQAPPLRPARTAMRALMRRRPLRMGIWTKRPKNQANLAPKTNKSRVGNFLFPQMLENSSKRFIDEPTC